MPEAALAVPTIMTALAPEIAATAGAAAAGGATAYGIGASALPVFTAIEGLGAAAATGATAYGLGASSLPVLADIPGGLAAGGAAGSAGVAKTAADAAINAGVTGVASSLLAPKRPDLPKPLAMPDPVEQEAARRRKIVEQMSRGGRASTIMTEPSGGKLGD